MKIKRKKAQDFPDPDIMHEELEDPKTPEQRKKELKRLDEIGTAGLVGGGVVGTAGLIGKRLQKKAETNKKLAETLEKHGGGKNALVPIGIGLAATGGALKGYAKYHKKKDDNSEA